VCKFRKFERRTTVEEKDMHLEPEEEKDTEAHVHHANLEPDEAVNARQDEEGDDVEGHVNQAVNQGVHHREDEGDDVEGHVNLGVNLEPADAVNLRQDDDDDVEGHVNLN
jgi:hypothetical protein